MKAKLIKSKYGDDFYYLMIGIDKYATTQKESFVRLSLKNCQAIERGYDLDELADKYFKSTNENAVLWRRIDFKTGFQKALEILGDKKFSEKQLKYNMLQLFYLEKYEYEVEAFFRERQLAFIENSIQSLQQTEWDVEIEVERSKFITDKSLRNDIKNGWNYTQKLDADGCIILKRI